jgi:hypothetical protein
MKTFQEWPPGINAKMSGTKSVYTPEFPLGCDSPPLIIISSFRAVCGKGTAIHINQGESK